MRSGFVLERVDAIIKGEVHMKFTKATLVASAAALSLGLAACDSPAEEAAEEDAEAIEAQADDMEAAGQITDAEADVMEEQADRVEDAAEGDTDMGTNDEPIGETVDESSM